MIEHSDPAPGCAGVAFRLRPNRSATPSELVAFYSAIALAALGTALFAASQGNVYAPVFAVLDVAVVGLAFWLVRKGGEREEHIALEPRAVTVRRRPGGFEASFNPHWVRLEARPGLRPNDPVRLMMGSHGRSVEVGAFLPEDERRELKDRLQQALAAIRAGGNPPDEVAAGTNSNLR